MVTIMDQKPTYEELEQRIEQLEKKANERSKLLRESQEKYRLLFSTIPDAIMVFDAETRNFIDANDAVSSLYGYSREEFINLNHKVITFEPDQSHKTIEQTISGEISHIPLRYHKHKNGTVFPVEISTGTFKMGNRQVVFGSVRDITTRMQAEEALLNSEIKHKSLLKNIPGMAYRAYPDWSADFYVGCQKISGYSSSELNAKERNWLDIIHPDDVERVRKEGASLVSKPNELVQQYRIITKSGKTRWVEDRKTTLVSENGELIGIDGVVFDITKRKRAEIDLENIVNELEQHVEARTAELTEANTRLRIEMEERKQVETSLRESEQKFRAIFNNMQDVFVRTNIEGQVVLVSPSAVRYYGVDSTDEIIGKDIAKHFYYRPEDREKLLAKLMKQGSLHNYHTIMKKKDGTPIPMEISGHLLHDKKGNIIGAEGILRDITEREKAEKALRDSEESLRSLMETATNFVVYRLSHDEQKPYRLNVVFVSPSIEKLMGVTDPMIFEKWFENVHPDDRKKIVEANRKALETLNFNETMRIYHPVKEDWRWIHAISTGIVDERGLPKYINGIMIDITERKRAEKALAEKTNNLEETNTALKVLLKKRNTDKAEIEEKVLLNVKELLEPYLEKLKKSGLNGRQMTFVNVLESNLKDLISSFTQKLSSKLFNLTPAELQVANFVKHGKNTKEIAILLNLSPKTIKNHRGNIRKKLELTKKRINLRSYLLAFD